MTERRTNPRPGPGPAARQRSRTQRWAVGVGIGALAAIGLVLLLLLTQATNHRELYERNYGWLLVTNVVVAGLLLLAILWAAVRLWRRLRRGQFGSRLLVKLAAIWPAAHTNLTGVRWEKDWFDWKQRRESVQTEFNRVFKAQSSR